MTLRHIVILASILQVPVLTNAQDTLKTSIDYDLTAEASAGTGDYTAYQLVTNRHHVMGTRANTAYLRGAFNVHHSFTKDLTLTGCADVVASIHGDHHAYLQQCFARLSYQSFFIEAGSREEEPVLRNGLLSSGALVKGMNAKPIPQVHFGTNGFWTVPFTNNWLQIDADFGYGKALDGSYREQAFRQSSVHNDVYATGIYYHQKHIYFRSNPEKRFFAAAGMEHVVQFGGTGYSYVGNELTVKKKPTDLKAFASVLIPTGDTHYFDNNALEDWRYGNHIGLISFQAGWNIDRHHCLQAYTDNLFEDGSGMRKGNGWDGLWGLQYDNKSAGRQYIRAAVLEYLQTTNQSGPLHWDNGDFPEPIRSQIRDLVVGNDNYYNHSFYGSYTHYGMALGNALVTSPIYNKNGHTTFLDNRVKAWHLAVNGELTNRLSYLVKSSYREGWGTYTVPLATKHHSFDALLQGQYQYGPWQFSAAYAFDQGNIYGDCSTLNIKIHYHGKIL